MGPAFVLSVRRRRRRRRYMQHSRTPSERRSLSLASACKATPRGWPAFSSRVFLAVVDLCCWPRRPSYRAAACFFPLLRVISFSLIQTISTLEIIDLWPGGCARGGIQFVFRRHSWRNAVFVFYCRAHRERITWFSFVLLQNIYHQRKKLSRCEVFRWMKSTWDANRSSFILKEHFGWFYKLKYLEDLYSFKRIR